MGLPGGTKTKTGQWATGAAVLEELAEQGHELPQKILDWRQVSKLRSTYTDALPELRQSADTTASTPATRWPPTTTGRLSSSEPNLQNIPIRTEEGRKIRRAFIADDGHASWSPPTIRRSSCGCSPRSPTCRRCARRSRTASTFTP